MLQNQLVSNDEHFSDLNQVVQVIKWIESDFGKPHVPLTFTESVQSMKFQEDDVHFQRHREDPGLSILLPTLAMPTALVMLTQKKNANIYINVQSW